VPRKYRNVSLPSWLLPPSFLCATFLLCNVFVEWSDSLCLIHASFSRDRRHGTEPLTFLTSVGFSLFLPSCPPLVNFFFHACSLLVTAPLTFPSCGERNWPAPPLSAFAYDEHFHSFSRSLLLFPCPPFF